MREMQETDSLYRLWSTHETHLGVLLRTPSFSAGRPGRLPSSSNSSWRKVCAIGSALRKPASPEVLSGYFTLHVCFIVKCDLFIFMMLGFSFLENFSFQLPLRPLCRSNTATTSKHLAAADQRLSLPSLPLLLSHACGSDRAGHVCDVCP